MSLSFEESLKNNSKNNIATTETMVATTDIDDMGVALPSVMTLEENFAIAAYSGDDGNWQQHPDYVYYHVFSDSNISNIDDEKNITLNRKQFNITQEENSRFKSSTNYITIQKAIEKKKNDDTKSNLCFDFENWN